jgi:Spy/CpxP family protein refolding chaperone
MRTLAVAAVCGFALAASALAAPPYAGLQSREIKAVSPERIDALLAGKGAGYALSAELNGYPGPRHVLDLGDQLELTADQRLATERLFARMQAEAIPLGQALIEKERSLEALFRDGRAEDGAIGALTAEIGALEGRLRVTHLKYHVDMANLLSAHQRVAYNRLRGYDAPPSGGQGAPMDHDSHGGHGG